MESVAKTSECYTLMTSLVAKDEDALKELYDRYSAPLYGVIIRIIRDDVLAEEVLQDCFISYWKKADSYDSDMSAPFTWMYRIAKNKALNALRDRDARTKRMAEANPIKDVKSEIDYDIKGLVSQLDDQDRKMILLSFYQGYTHEEIQEIESIPLGTVKSRMRRALKNLRVLTSPRIAILLALIYPYMP